MKIHCNGFATLSISLPNRLLLVHLFMLYSQMHKCLPLTHLPLNFPSSMIFLSVLCHLMWLKYNPILQTEVSVIEDRAVLQIFFS